MIEHDEALTCGNCRHYLWAGPLAGWGECRRFPPVLQPVTTANAGDERERTKFPKVTKYDWCGEFSDGGDR